MIMSQEKSGISACPVHCTKAMMIIVLTLQFAMGEPPSIAFYENSPQEPLNAELTHSSLM